MRKEWFKEWFDTPYYHTLYKYRDDKEAISFINRLLEHLEPDEGARMLDLACGKGRYSRHLASKGYEVVGLDLSEQSIAYARQFEHNLLTYYKHDMRQIFRTNYFDFVFNFFTSFGYFKTDKEHERTLKTIVSGLRPDGIFVLDYFNALKVLKSLPTSEVRIEDGIRFDISKREDNGHILKQIRFETNGHQFDFTESVRAFTLADFEYMFRRAKLDMIEFFGDYNLGEYDPAHSDRLIVVGKKGRTPVIFGID